jgi:hypothetical protein
MLSRTLAIAFGLVFATVPAHSQTDFISADQICASRDSTFVARCFSVHARLEPGGDNVAVWIWPVGTSRYLGYLGDGRGCALPPRLDSLMTVGKTVYADIVVRPISRSRPGHMQFVCIAAVHKLIVRDHRL